MAKKLTLSTKLLGLTGLVTAIGLGVGILAVTQKSGSVTQEISYREGDEVGKRSAVLVEDILGDALQTARITANTLLHFKTSGLTDRDNMNDWLKTVLADNPHYTGLWVGMEPNAFGNDADYVGSPGSDQTGRFLSNWNRVSGELMLEPLTGYDDPGEAGAFYHLPKSSGVEVLIEPYSYKVAGKDVMMVSIANPIKENGKVIGVVGVDISTENLVNALKPMKPFETGSVSLISNGGKWVAYSNLEHLGKPIQDTNEKLLDALDPIREGRQHTQPLA